MLPLPFLYFIDFYYHELIPFTDSLSSWHGMAHPLGNISM
jgi:hypothetical protein